MTYASKDMAYVFPAGSPTDRCDWVANNWYSRIFVSWARTLVGGKYIMKCKTEKRNSFEHGQNNNYQGRNC
jgi:hypothetical protein